ncbi:hypothetical protein CLOP_g5252 [Closterium sp. NIES-67]|nr:hypothetical protein CLOP_g5252 [Closterium sp. NIES-67]
MSEAKKDGLLPPRGSSRKAMGPRGRGGSRGESNGGWKKPRVCGVDMRGFDGEHVNESNPFSQAPPRKR